MADIKTKGMISHNVLTIGANNCMPSVWLVTVATNIDIPDVTTMMIGARINIPI